MRPTEAMPGRRLHDTVPGSASLAGRPGTAPQHPALHSPDGEALHVEALQRDVEDHAGAIAIIESATSCPKSTSS